MSAILRQSPVSLLGVAANEEARGGWKVVLAYRDERDGPWLVDLSHRQRWDFQHKQLDSQRPFGLEVPREPGQVSLQRGQLISRMNATQVSITQLGQSDVARVAAESGYTETTDASCMLAITGINARRVMEQLSKLDLFHVGRELPFLTQGPVMHIPCQIVTLTLDCVLMTCSRAYGQTFADAVLQVACTSGLWPAGEKRFNDWMATGGTDKLIAYETDSTDEKSCVNVQAPPIPG